MNILLSSEQIVDLIFEKKLSYGGQTITMKDSGLCTLSKLEERLENGKILSGKGAILRKYNAR